MKKNKNIFLLLWPYIWSKQSRLQKTKFLIFVLATLMTTSMLMCVPLLLKYALMALENPQAPLFMMPIWIIILYALAWMFSKIIDRLRHQAAFPMIANIIHKLCLDVFIHLQELSMRFHHDKKSGKIADILDRTRFAIASFTMAIAQELIPIILQVLCASLLLGYFYGFSYCAVLLIMLLCYILLSVKSAENIVLSRQKQNTADGQANAFMVDSILNAETVKYFGTEEHEIEKARNLLNQKEQADIASLMSDAKVHLIQNTIIGFAVIILISMSGYAVLNHHIHVSDFVMINAFILMFVGPLSTIGYRYREAKMQLTHLESAFELLQEPIEIYDTDNAKSLNFQGGKISFDKVRFGYNKENTILDNLSFCIEPGTTTAIVGASGSGKSTISKLLFRLYDIEHGSIKIDQQDILNLTLKSLRNTIAMVPQDTVMFNDTIAHNILYPDINRKLDLHPIIEQVELDALIHSLPDGLDTIVGERGLKLSGGERQRLAIARMLTRNPKIMVFDEATSALDLKTEKKIQQCLERICQQHTTLIIAHRLSTIKHADNIIVLDHGRIVEQGTHQALLAKKGSYYQLLKQQNDHDKKKGDH